MLLYCSLNFKHTLKFKHNTVVVAGTDHTDAGAETDQVHTHRARLCIIHAWHDDRGLGFNIHAGHGRAAHYIGTVDAGSPAAAAGLRDGDRVLEVNGINIDQLGNEEVSAEVKSDPNTVSLLVVDQQADEYFSQRNITVTSDMEHCVQRITGPQTKPQGLLTRFCLTQHITYDVRPCLIFSPENVHMCT